MEYITKRNKLCRALTSLTEKKEECIANVTSILDNIKEPEVIEQILNTECFEFDINYPLFVLISQQNVKYDEIVKEISNLLIHKGAKTDIKNRIDRSLLQVAFQYGYEHTSKFFIDMVIERMIDTKITKTQEEKTQQLINNKNKLVGYFYAKSIFGKNLLDSIQDTKIKTTLQEYIKTKISQRLKIDITDIEKECKKFMTPKCSQGPKTY